MKRILSKAVIALIITCVLTILCITPASAAETGAISANRNYTVKTGEYITVTVTYSASEKFKSIEGTIEFDNTLFQCDKTDNKYVVNFTGNVVNVKATPTDNLTTIPVKFKAIAPGKAVFTSALTGTKEDGTKGATVRQSNANRRVTVTGTAITEAAAPEPDALNFEFEGAHFSIVVPEISYPDFELYDSIYNNANIKTLNDKYGKYKLVFAKNNDDLKTYLFNLTEEGKIEFLEYIVINDDIYIIENPDTANKEPDGDWQIGKCTLSNGLTVDCFESKKSVMSDFYVFLCYHGGKSAYFRYDKATNILQREPGFALIDYQPVESPSHNGLINRMAVLSSEAKSLIFLAMTEFILIVVLIILIVLRRRKNPLPVEEE